MDDLKKGTPEYEQLELEKLFQLIHNKSKEIREQNLKNGTNIDTVVIDGVNYPIDYSENCGTFEEVLEQVKKAKGIPENVGYTIESSYDRGERYNANSEILVFTWVENGKEKEVRLRNDFHGHPYEEGYELISHINDPLDRHFFY